MSSSDKELTRLIKRAMRGDQQAFEALYRRYLKEIIFQARKLLDIKEDAEDAAQEIVLALYRNIKKLSSPFAFHAYLYRTIYTTCTNKNMRHGGKDLPLEDFEETLPEDEEAQPEQRFAELEIKAEIRELVDQLAPKQRLCVYLYYFYDMSYEEIAQVLNATTNAVGVNLTKARKAMERLLTKNKPDEQGERGANVVTRGGMALAPLVCDALHEGINLEVSEQTVANVAAACQTLIAAAAATVSAGTATTAVAAPLKSIVSTTLAVTVMVGGGGAAVYYAQQAADADRALTETRQQVIENSGFVPQAKIDIKSKAALANSGADSADNSETGSSKTKQITTAYLSTNEGWGEAWHLYDTKGKTLATGAGDKIEGPLDELAPGQYTIKWVIINDDYNRAIATQSFTVG